MTFDSRLLLLSAASTVHGWFCRHSHQRRPSHSSTPSSAAALTTVMPCYTELQTQRLQSVQNAAVRLVTGLQRTEFITPTLKSLHRSTWHSSVIHASTRLTDFDHLATDRSPSLVRAPSTTCLPDAIRKSSPTFLTFTKLLKSGLFV